MDPVSPNDKISLYSRAVVQSQGGIFAVEAHYCCVGVNFDRRASAFWFNSLPSQLIVQVDAVDKEPILEVPVLLGQLI